jgi:hypothetical protein
VVILGTHAMFFETYAPRHFYFDFIPPSRQAWSGVQQGAINLTQRLLNLKSTWLVEGPQQAAEANPSSATVAPGTLSALTPPPYIPMVRGSPPSPGAVKSPPGQEKRHELYQPAAPTLTAQGVGFSPERVAMANLKKLGDANIPQTAATLFVDPVGEIRVILYARPTSDSLGFVSDQDTFYHILRVEMHGGSVHVEHPFDPPNAAQAAVARVMETVLQEACRSHAEKYYEQQRRNSASGAAM